MHPNTADRHSRRSLYCPSGSNSTTPNSYRRGDPICKSRFSSTHTTETHVRSASLTDQHHPCCVLRQNTLQSYAPFENRVIVIRHVSGRVHAVHGCSALLVHEDAILCLAARVGHEIDIWFDPDADDREIAGDPPPAFRDDPLDASGALECHDSIFEDGLDTRCTSAMTSPTCSPSTSKSGVRAG